MNLNYTIGALTCKSMLLMLLVATIVLLSSCGRPPSATFKEGSNPFNVDKDVVFRTTYYFRVFDYCVAKKLKRKEFAEIVVPLTDSLYRFRMTGKANSLISDIKFESGTLMSWQIDPFGSKVEYDPESRRARVISPKESETDAQLSTIQRQINDLIAIYDRFKGSMPENSDEFSFDEAMTAITNKLNEVIQSYPTQENGPINNDVEHYQHSRQFLNEKDRFYLVKNEVKKILREAVLNSKKQQLDKNGQKLESTENVMQIKSVTELVDNVFNSPEIREFVDIENPGFLERALKIVSYSFDGSNESNEDLLKDFSTDGSNRKDTGILQFVNPIQLEDSQLFLNRTVAQFVKPESIFCPDDAPVRRGFQVLGPEGWRTFDQNERLILAMSSSAEPLISTLKDVSNRVISTHENQPDELFQIILEQKRFSEVERKFDARLLTTELALDDVAKTVCEDLLAGTGDENRFCN